MVAKLRFDVAVVGGGMIGATLACALAKGGVQVALLESRQPQRSWGPETVDLRVSALTEGTKNILDAVGVWPCMEKLGVSPYRFMRVWDPKYGGDLSFDAADLARDILGHIVENRITVAALWEIFERQPSGAVLCPQKVVDIRHDDSGYSLCLDNQSVLESELIIAADGANSAIRSMVGIEVGGWSYGQHGLVAVVETELHHSETAYQWFLEEGPLAFLPLRDGRCSIVWTSSTDTTQQNLAQNEAEFLSALTQASSGVLGDVKSVGERASFPLALQYATRYFHENVVLVGDAAHSVHPLAGQGANMGMLDVAALAEVLLDARSAGRPLSSRQVLRKYERWRKGDNLAMLASMDLLKRVFTGSLGSFEAVRSMGMNAVNRLQPLKDAFNRHAMGLRTDLPRLAYGESCWNES